MDGGINIIGLLQGHLMVDLTFVTAIGNWTLASREKLGTQVLRTAGLSEAEPPPNNLLIVYFYQ